MKLYGNDSRKWRLRPHKIRTGLQSALMPLKNKWTPSESISKKTLTLSRRRFLPPATPPSSQTIAVYSLHNYNYKMCHDRLAVLPTTPDCSVHATHRLSSRIQLHARARPPRQQRFSPSWVRRETSRNEPGTSQQLRPARPRGGCGSDRSRGSLKVISTPR